MRLRRWIFRTFMRGFLRLLPHRDPCKSILFLCQNGLMADYLRPVWDCVRDDPRLRCWLTVPEDERTQHEGARIRAKLPLEEISLRWAHVQPWDLIVTADHGHGDLATNDRCPVIYTGHGITGKVVEGEEEDYSYGPRTRRANGRPRYSCMFEAAEANRDRVVRAHPEYTDVIDVVGSLQDDEVLAETPRRDEIREALGYRPEDRVVFVVGSWGEHSLFHVIGDELIEAARGLMGEYHFTLCAHPHEYRPQPGGERVWGEHLRTLVAEGFRVREPAESWTPHLTAADVIVTDHTSLAIYGVLAHKPMIYSPVPDESIQEGTALWKLRAMCHTLADPARLGEELEWALEQFPFERLEALANEINSRPGEARALVSAAVYRLLRLDEPDGVASATPPAVDPGARRRSDASETAVR